jgi:hypothetical protein
MDGTVLDLSLHGCRLSSNTPVNTGMVFTLRIEVPGCEEPIQIERAEVRWVRGQEFGLSFYAFTTKASEHLVEVIQQLQRQTNEVAVSPPLKFIYLSLGHTTPRAPYRTLFRGECSDGSPENDGI